MKLKNKYLPSPFNYNNGCVAFDNDICEVIFNEEKCYGRIIARAKGYTETEWTISIDGINEIIDLSRVLLIRKFYNIPSLVYYKNEYFNTWNK